VKVLEKTLKQMILNEVATHPKGYLTELAEIAGYTGTNKGSNLNKVLIDEKKEFDNFTGLVNLFRHLWGNDSLKMMVRYSEEVDPKKKTARNLLEGLVINREFEAFNTLLEKMDSCTNKESQEYARVYKLQYKYELARTCEDYNTLLREISLTNITLPELKVYQKMLLCYCFDQINDYTMTKILSREINDEIELIENEFIKDSYTIRLNEVMSYIQLRVYNDPEAARECAEKILSSNARLSFKGFAYYIKGFSYLFTSLDETVTYLTKSIEIYEELNRPHDVEKLKEDLELAYTLWNKIEQNKQLSVDKIELKLYFEGCIDKDTNKLMLSLVKFIKKNDLFLANLPKIELLKNGYNSEILEEMMLINMPKGR
jgi:hypothetical protein